MTTGGGGGGREVLGVGTGTDWGVGTVGEGEATGRVEGSSEERRESELERATH